ARRATCSETSGVLKNAGDDMRSDCIPRPAWRRALRHGRMEVPGAMARSAKMRVLAVGLTLIVTAATAAAQDGGSARRAPTKDERPEIVLRASPNLAFSPARVSLRAELRGGADDFEEYYCTTVEWIWGDGTSSEASMDCEPYEPGRSEI